MMNDKVPIVEMLKSGINLIELARSDLTKLQTYVSGHQYDIDSTPYLYAIDAANQQINAFAGEFNAPMFTVTEAENSPVKAKVQMVPDGDGIIVEGPTPGETREFRMVGINAQEIGTEEGQLAQQYLESLVLGKEVEMYMDEYQPVERYGRGLGVIRLDGVDINQEMLRNCLAVPLTKYGRHKYVDHVENQKIYERCKDLHRGYGTIRIHTDPTNADISIKVDNVWKYYGRTTVETELPTGQYQIRLSKIDCSTTILPFTVMEGKMERTFPLLKTPIKEGLVEVKETNDLPDCYLVVDDTVLGILPIITRLSSNAHKIRITKEGYAPIEDNVAPALGRLVTKTVTMLKSA